MIPTPEVVPLDVIDRYANTICPTCLGDGSYEVQASTPPDAIEPRYEWVPCPDCHATGWTGIPLEVAA